MRQRLVEYADSRGLRVGVDRAAGIIRGVKILGLESRNGRSYLPDALAGAIALYEGARVNVNHARGGARGPRDYQDRIGLIRQARFESGAGLFGDLCFNPRHALAEQLLWDAEHAPENVGLSHNVDACTSQRDGRTIVESIAAVHSVDLVADPATTQGLFEEAAVGPRHEIAAGELQAEIETLRGELDQARTALALATRRELVREALEEHGLPAQGGSGCVVSAAFYESLLAAGDERGVRRLIEERAALVRQARAEALRSARRQSPRAMEQLAADGALAATTTAEFVRAIARG
jgi:hypothetical protein